MKSENNEIKNLEGLNEITPENVQEARGKTRIPPIPLALCVAAIILFFSIIFPLVKVAETAGKVTGKGSGTAAGIAVGSVEGALQGAPEGYEEGKKEGLSAEDTVAKIANTVESNISGLGNLEVLVANVELTTYHEVGKKYGALYLTRGSAVFTVNLNNVMVTHKKGLISIVLPRPEVEIKIDSSETEVLSEWQRKYFDGKDSEGFEASLNTIKAMKNVSEDEVANYSELQALACDSAVRQVEEIAYAVRGNDDTEISVSIQSNLGGLKDEY